MTRPLDTPEDVLAFPLEGTRLIEASAGTGKTYTIANLYLRHVLAGATVGQLLVVPFTDAATAELKAADVAFKMDPFTTPVCQMAFIFDPDKNVVCIHKRHAGHN